MTVKHPSSALGDCRSDNRFPSRFRRQGGTLGEILGRPLYARNLSLMEIGLDRLRYGARGGTRHSAVEPSRVAMPDLAEVGAPPNEELSGRTTAVRGERAALPSALTQLPHQSFQWPTGQRPGASLRNG